MGRHTLRVMQTSRPSRTPCFQDVAVVAVWGTPASRLPLVLPHTQAGPAVSSCKISAMKRACCDVFIKYFRITYTSIVLNSVQLEDINPIL